MMAQTRYIIYPSEIYKVFFYIYLISCWTPINKIDQFRLLDMRNGCIDIFGDHVASVQQADSHVLSFRGQLISDGNFGIFKSPN